MANRLAFWFPVNMVVCALVVAAGLAVTSCGSSGPELEDASDVQVQIDTAVVDTGHEVKDDTGISVDVEDPDDSVDDDEFAADVAVVDVYSDVPAVDVVQDVPPVDVAQDVPVVTDTGNASARYICTVCDWIYDPAKGDPTQGIPKGTSFADLPANWKCPECGLGKGVFRKL